MGVPAAERAAVAILSRVCHNAWVGYCLRIPQHTLRPSRFLPPLLSPVSDFFLLLWQEMVLVDETEPLQAPAAPSLLNGAAMGAAKNRHTKMVEEEEFRTKKEAAKSALEVRL